MADTTHAVMFTARQQAELLEEPRDTSPLEANEVAGPTLATLISAGTELAGSYTGDRFPGNPGYACVYQVEAVGSDVADLKPGDRVFGMVGHKSYQRCRREHVLPIPDGLSSQEAAFARMMCVTMSTLSTTTARPPAKMVVTGLGLVGHLGARMFQSCGYQVIACDPDERRRRLAQEAGLKDVRPAVPLDDEDVAGKVDLVLECSGHEQAALDGVNVVRRRGEVVLVGTPWRKRTDRTAHELVNRIFFTYAVVRSGWEWELPHEPTNFRPNSIYGNIAAALRWLAEGRITAGDLYTAVAPRDCQQAYQDLLNMRAERLAIVFDWSDCP